MATHNVIVPGPMEQTIEELVQTGRYQNFSEVVRAGLRMLIDHEAQEQARLEALRTAASIGIMQLNTGQFDEVDLDNLDEYLGNLGQADKE